MAMLDLWDIVVGSISIVIAVMCATVCWRALKEEVL